MSMIAVVLGIVWFMLCTMIWHRPIYRWFKRQNQRHRVKKTIHRVLVEPRADVEALAFALAVSNIPSEDLLTASAVHPAIKDRFSNRGKRRIAEQAFLLRKDEHHDFYHNLDNWDTKLHDALREDRRHPRQMFQDPEFSRLFLQVRESLRQLEETLRTRTESSGQTQENSVEPKTKKESLKKP